MTRPNLRKPPSRFVRLGRTLRLATLAMGLGLPAMASSRAHAQHSASPISDASAEDAVLSRINELRREHGLGPLARDARLDSAALTHSAEMSSLTRLMHVSSTTGSPLDRTQAVGVSSHEIAENVARGPSTSDAQGTLEASAPHLANILNPSFTHIGISSVAHTPGFYLTEVFARMEEAVPAPEPVVAGLPASTLDGSRIQPIVPTPEPPTFTTPEDVEIPAAPLLEGEPNQSLRVEENGATAYWICSDGRWWFYPVPTGAMGGQRLTPDLSRTGSPPGYGACARVRGQGAVQVGLAAPGQPTQATQGQPSQAAQGQPVASQPAQGEPGQGQAPVAPGYGRPGRTALPGQQPAYHAPLVVQPGQPRYPQQQYPQQQYPQQQYPQQQVPATAYQRGYR